MVGADATVASGAVIDGGDVRKGAVVRACAVVSPGAVVADNSVLGEGSCLPSGTTTSPGELWTGSPATCERALSQEELETIAATVAETVTFATAHANECGKTHEQIEAEKLRQMLIEERSEDYNSHMGLLGREREVAEIQARIIENDREEQRKIGAA